MSSEKLEYDASRGGSVHLEDTVHTFRYAAANVKEIHSLLHEISNPVSTKLVFQTLPKHMRRRAMSHHPKRLPRRYRAIHKSQMAKAGKPTISKRPSRKYRRKPSNLLKEYLRRQQKNIWLETHIWHAKRFHMISKWGYKLPWSSCDKTYRACYRATAKHCLLQDISFFGCLQIVAPLDELRKGFGLITSAKCGLGVCAKTFLTGKREGQVDLFRPGQYPDGVLGRVSFLWKPEYSAEQTTRQLWLFVHPSFYAPVLETLITIFALKSTKTIKVPIEEPESSANVPLKFMTKTFAYSRAPVYKDESSSIVLTELKDTFNRFRLTGPLSQSVLAKSLKVKAFKATNEPENWFKSALESEAWLEAHNAQQLFWENAQNLNSPAELLSNMVISLNVEDPRINRPDKRSKAVPAESACDASVFLDTSEKLCRSPLWDFDLRNKICETMLSTHEYCSQRNKNAVVPGQRCRFEDELQPVPVILIQRPGSQENSFKRLGYGCGWDVIVPSGYGMPVWMSLIMWGAKPGGLRELNSLQKELGNEQFLPDTLSGQQDAANKSNDLKTKYFRLPPNKRSNYRKLAIVSPFKPPLGQLVKEWMHSESDSFHVLRDRDLLQQLLTAVTRNQTLPDLPANCLVQIHLRMKTRGNPGDFAVICIPKKEDLKRNLKYIKFRKNDPVYVEPLRKDDTEVERKQLRTEHKRVLKRLRSRRVREKRHKEQTSTTRVQIREAGTSQLVSDQFKKMCNLWLPETPATVRHQCSREVLGYMTQSDFSFTEATVTGVGYVTVDGLKKLLAVCGKGEKMVLVRGTKTRNYRLASFKVNCHI